MGGLSLLVIVGATLGVGGALLQGLTGLLLEIVLSFGAAELLYLVTEELLVEAHEVKETPWITSAFFLGFIALYLIELLACTDSAWRRTPHLARWWPAHTLRPP